eukprot:c15078_g1_i1.p1 GENE.c15078_g1_i1~~c15078_g1_i1.p1  ORF type:complete len:429 (+),score=47.30 c15078_g1_i1:42-1328(+)
MQSPRHPPKPLPTPLRAADLPNAKLARSISGPQTLVVSVLFAVASVHFGLFFDSPVLRLVPISLALLCGAAAIIGFIRWGSKMPVIQLTDSQRRLLGLSDFRGVSFQPQPRPAEFSTPTHPPNFMRNRKPSASPRTPNESHTPSPGRGAPITSLAVAKQFISEEKRLAEIRTTYQSPSPSKFGPYYPEYSSPITYQLSPTKSLTTESTVGMQYQEIVSYRRLEQLGVPLSKLHHVWVPRLQTWIATHIFANLLSQREKESGYFPSPRPVDKVLEIIDSNPAHILHIWERIRVLSGRSQTDYAWGGPVERRTESSSQTHTLPSDARIIINLFMLELTNQLWESVRSDFLSKHLIPFDRPYQPTADSIAIREASLQPPRYDVISGTEQFILVAGRDNPFMAIALFIYFVGKNHNNHLLHVSFDKFSTILN